MSPRAIHAARAGIVSTLVLPALLLAPLLIAGQLARAVGDGRVVAVVVISCIWCLAEALCAPDAMGEVRGTGPQWLPTGIGTAVLATFWLSLLTAGQIQTHSALTVLAFTVMVGGILLRVLSIHMLGRHFLNEVAVLPGQQLVTSGVYGVVRHPSEVGTISLATGAAILLSSIPALTMALFVLLPLVWWRTRLEDGELRSEFPSEFAEYERRVRAFVPRLSPLPPPRET